MICEITLPIFFFLLLLRYGLGPFGVQIACMNNSDGLFSLSPSCIIRGLFGVLPTCLLHVCLEFMVIGLVSASIAMSETEVYSQISVLKCLSHPN
jgi:hypothetical protein